MSHTESQWIRVRDRFRTGEAPAASRIAVFGRFLRLALRKARSDALPTQSAALAFITVLSLVPLLASLSHFSAGFFEDRLDEMVDLLAGVLPYTEGSINEQLRLFLRHSQSLRGFGLLAFLLTALTAFGMIEKTIHDIWNLPRRRPLRGRLNSFVMLIAWGPLLIGAAYSISFLVRQHPAFERVAASLPLGYLPFAVTLLGLTMLNWQVPYTRVGFRYALIGGASSAVLLELLGEAFSVYSQRLPQMSLVYGSFGFALFFMVSIQMSWAIVLLGTELTYCVQNYRALAKPRRPSERFESSWLGLAALVFLIEGMRRHEPVIGHEELAASLGIGNAELRGVLTPLVRARYLQESLGGTMEGYMLACDPYRARASEVLDAYEEAQWTVLPALPEDAASRLEEMRARLAVARQDIAGDLVLAELAPGARSEDLEEPRREADEE
ncbi:MAG: YhjD/YihY/BrkB family envelope integrity protein [Acidobacteriota bacterium]